MWRVECYNEDYRNPDKVVPAKNKHDAAMKRDSLKGKYEHVDVYEDDDYIDPCEL